MTVIEMIRLVGKEFAYVTDAELEKWMEIAEPMVSKRKFKKLYNQALAYMICHLMKLNGLGDGEDAAFGTIADALRVASYSEGSRSISFGGLNLYTGTSDAALGLTVYGMQFINIRKMVIVPITMAGVDQIAE